MIISRDLMSQLRKILNFDGQTIREAENLFTSKWHCLDFIWSVINHIYPFLSHFDLMKSQKFEIEPVIWKDCGPKIKFKWPSIQSFTAL
jgi:hypothetical protein